MEKENVTETEDNERYSKTDAMTHDMQASKWIER